MKKLLVSLSVCVFVFAFTAPVGAQVGYGRSVAIDGDDVLVGEPGNRATSGFVYIYRFLDGAWTEVAELSAADATESDGFGAALSVDGDLLLISAVNDARGIVHLFSREDGEWNGIGTLSPSGEGDAAGFGRSIARDGDTLLVGARAAEDGWGAAYIFRMDSGRWVQQTRLIGERLELTEFDKEAKEAAEAEEAAAQEAERAAEGEEGEEGEGDERPDPTPERFGTSVTLWGDWAFVGAPNANQNAGLVYGFHRSESGEWERIPTLDYSEENDLFGSALDIADGFLAVGAPQVQPLGAVHRFFLEESGEWVRDASVFAFEGMAYRFGAAVAIQGDDLYIASTLHIDNGGMVYRFAGDGKRNITGVAKISTAGFVQGDFLGQAMALQGDTMVLGAPGDDGGAGTAVIMSRNLGGWERAKVFSDVKGLPAITGSTIECTDGFADRFACDGIDLLAFLPTHEIGGRRGTQLNDIWGWTDPETGRDYALVGLSIATSFVDVTDPHNPVYVGKLAKTEGAPESAWRDIKIHADHAFIVSDAAPQHGVQIFDLTRLRDYDGEPIEFTEDAHYDQISAAHNIVINESSAFAFVVGASSGGETCGGGLHMINIEDPRHPSFAGCFADVSTGRQGTGYSHDAQCVVYNGPDTQYRGHEICFGSNETALSIADVTDKRNPVALGMATYPNVAYAHQGWLTEDHSYFYMNDEGDEISGLVPGTRTLIWDVQELEDPIFVGAYQSDNPSVDHNLYVKGDVMYQSNYDSGLRVFDISDPEKPRPIGYLDTVPFGEDGAGGMSGSWSNYPYFESGIVVVTSMSEGIFVVRVREVAGGS